MLLGQVVSVALLAAQAPSIEHAALLNVRGEPGPARAEIDAVLLEHPQAPSALFTAACIAVEAGALDDARRFAARLRQGSLAPPHAVVLDALIERRARNASEPIDEALAEAWKAAGRPDLGSRAILPKMESWGALLPEMTPETVKGMTAAERLLFGNEYDAMSEATLKLALKAASTAESNPLVVNVEILGVIAFRDDAPAAMQVGVDRAAASLGPRVATFDEGNGYLAVAAWLATGRARQPLEEADLALLESALARPRFSVPRQVMFSELKKMAARLDPRFGALRAQVAALGAPVPLVRLSRRAEATTVPALRRRAAKILLAMADRVATSGMLLERMLAAAMETNGARLLGDADLIAKSREKTARVQAQYRAMTAATERLGTWPFGAPWRDWEPEREVEYFGRLLEPSR